MFQAGIGRYPLHPLHGGIGLDLGKPRSSPVPPSKKIEGASYASLTGGNLQLLCQLKLTLENKVLSKEKKRGVVCLEIAVCWLLRDCSFNVTCECAYVLRKVKKEKGVVKK